MLGLMLLWLVGLVLPLPEALQVPSLLPDWHGVVLGATCLLQFAISLVIDRRYEPGVGRNVLLDDLVPLRLLVPQPVHHGGRHPQGVGQAAGHPRHLGQPGPGSVMEARETKLETAPEPAPVEVATRPWPPLIRRPQAQRRAHRRIYQLVTLVAWGGWLYLFLPLVTLLLWLGGLQTVWVEASLAGRVG